MQIQVGIITISDRASAGDYDDLGGPALKQVAQKIGWHVLAEAIVPDETGRIQETIQSFSMQGCGLILISRENFPGNPQPYILHLAPR